MKKMFSGARPFRFSFLLLLIALLPFSCKEQHEEKQKTTPRQKEVRKEREKPTPKGTIAFTGKKRENENVRASISADGLPYRIPTKLVVQFYNLPTYDIESFKSEYPRITPHLPGEVRFYKSKAYYEFRPSKLFSYNTDYSFEAPSVNINGKKYTPPSSGAWNYTFKTPPFELRDVFLDRVNLKKRYADLILHFTGPVDKDSLKNRMKLFVNGRSPQKVEIETYSTDPSQLVVRLHHYRLAESAKLIMGLDRGISDEHGRAETESSHTRVFDIGDKKEVQNLQRIKRINARLKESNTGWYLQVVCYEEHWRRCRIPETALREKVHVTPPVNARFVPDRRGFRILGNFHRGSYGFTAEAGLQTESGSILTKTYTEDIRVSQRTPKVEFASKGRYLPRQRLKSVPIRHLNVDEVEIEVRRIPEKNLVFWLSGDRETATERTSDLVAEEHFTVRRQEDRKLTSWVNLGRLLPEGAEGVFEFKVKAKGARDTDAIRLVLTDLTMVTKRFGKEGRDLLVWVLDSEKLNPVDNATVEVMSVSNRRLAAGETDSGGFVHFENLTDPIRVSDKKPFALVARSGDDLTFLKFSELQVPLSEYPVQGERKKTKSPYRVAVYMDRDVYRPGETAHLVGVVWEKNENRAPKTGLPVTGKLYDPKGKEMHRFTARTNEAGMVTYNISFNDYALTGNYNFYIDIGKKRAAQHSFMVEEFVPERIKAEVSSLDEAVLMSESSRFRLNARYLFGAVAKGEKMEARCSVKAGEFEPEEYPGYTFNVWRDEPFQAVPLDTVEGKLDDKGAALITCRPVEEVSVVKGPAKVVVDASVFEAGSGRTTKSHASVTVHPDDFYIGLNSDSKEVNVGRKTTVEGVVVDLKGNPLDSIANVKIELIEVQSDWIWEYDPQTGRSKREHFSIEVPVEERVVKVRDGKFAYSFTPHSYSQGYVVRAKAGPRVQTDLYLRGPGYYWYWWGRHGDTSATPPPSEPKGLLIESPDDIKVDEKATVTATLPYPGRMLFTVETGHVIEQRWIDAEAGPVNVNFTLREFYPNVYVSCLLVKDPFFESSEAFIPGRAFGVKNIKVRPTQSQLPLKLEVAGEVKPNEDLVIELESEAGREPVYATVAAVDEGIHQLTDYRNPDPLGVMFSRRALGVETFETVGWTLLLPPVPESSTGGDGALMEAEEARRAKKEGIGRIQMVKPVAMWSGVLEFDKGGKARVKFHIPTYQGQLRVVAVAAALDKMAVDSADVKVRDSLVLQPTFPRFLISGDKFALPVFLTNMTGRKETVEVELRTDDAVMVEGRVTKDIILEKGESGLVTFKCEAAGAQGGADFEVVAVGSKTVSRDSVEAPLIPDGPVTRESYSHKLKEGANNLTGYFEGWNPQYESTTVTVMPNRYGKELGHLKYLIRYPYGCIEQTSSSTMPLLYISKLLLSIDPDILEKGALEQRFMHGVDRMLSMQTADGGFSYWPGSDNPAYWSSAYATYILLKGKEKGYPINKLRLRDAVDFIEDSLNYRKRSGRRRDRVVYAEPFMHYVLARAGKGQAARIRELIRKPKEKWEVMKEENLFLLKAALYLSGDRTYEEDLKEVPPAFTSKRKNGWTFWSSLRTRGIMLNVMEELWPGSEAAEPLARNIARYLHKSSRHYTTQELAWCVSGLGKRSTQAASMWSRPYLSMDGKSIEPLSNSDKENRSSAWQVSGASGAEEISLKVDKIEGGHLFAMVQIEGIKPGVDYETGDNFIRVSRVYKNSDGDEINPQNLMLGDLVYVELTLENLSDEYIRNVAMVDRFSAGFDVQNPRLDRKMPLDWVNDKDLWETTYTNIRDDRVEYFGNLKANAKVKAVYALRAVVGGDFSTPPVEAEAMYDPRIFSRHKGGRVMIKDPWQVITD